MVQLDLPPDTAFIPKYVSKAGTPAPDPLYSHGGWGSFYRGVQCA